MSERQARVSRDRDGNALGVALFINAEALPDGVAEQDRIAYLVRKGRVVLQV